MDSGDDYHPPEWTSTEDWLASLGTKFVTVWVFGGGKSTDERHVADDIDILLVTIKQSLDRIVHARHAVFPYQGRWALYSPYRVRDQLVYHDTQEAAEMIAIHRG